MKINQVVRMLKKEGCVLKRHGADHDVWYNPKTGKSASLPRHGSKELGKGLLRKFFKTLLGE